MCGRAKQLQQAISNTRQATTTTTTSRKTATARTAAMPLCVCVCVYVCVCVCVCVHFHSFEAMSMGTQKKNTMGVNAYLSFFDCPMRKAILPLIVPGNQRERAESEERRAES